MKIFKENQGQERCQDSCWHQVADRQVQAQGQDSQSQPVGRQAQEASVRHHHQHAHALSHHRQLAHADQHLQRGRHDVRLVRREARLRRHPPHPASESPCRWTRPWSSPTRASSSSTTSTPSSVCPSRATRTPWTSW
jgi:hypothetical protein